MINDRIFGEGGVGEVCVGFFFVCLFLKNSFMVPSRLLLSTLATPPVSFVQMRLLVLL